MTNKNKNKNKFIIVVSSVSILMLSILLNGCHTGVDTYNMHEDESTLHTNGKTGKNGIHISLKESQENAKICPWCRQGALFVYKLSNTEKSLILLCEECEAMWLDPEDLSLNGAANDQKIADKFGAKKPEELFENSDWATKEEAESSKWKKLVHSNMVLIK